MTGSRVRITSGPSPFYHSLIISVSLILLCLETILIKTEPAYSFVLWLIFSLSLLSCSGFHVWPQYCVLNKRDGCFLSLSLEVHMILCKSKLTLIYGEA